MAINDELLNAQTLHSARLEFLKNGIVRKMLSLLAKSDAELSAQLTLKIQNLTGTAFSIERIENQLASIYALNRAIYGDVNNELDTQLSLFAEYEAEFQQSTLTRILPLQVSFTEIAISQVYAAAVARPFQGKLLKEWMEELEADTAVKIRDAVRLGIIQNETTDQIVRRIRGTRANGYKDGLLAISRRNAQAIVRTAVSHTATVARNAVYEANNELLKGEQWHSTLDSRTTPQCFISSTECLPVGDLENVFRAKYRGKLITITTASGNKLVGTPNHPILTSDGFLPMGEINPSKHIVYSVLPDTVDVIRNKDVRVKSDIGATFDSFNKPALFNVSRVSPSAIDFYGDGVGMYDKVDIISTNGKLRGWIKSTFNKFVKNKCFSFIHDGFCFSRFCKLDNRFLFMSKIIKASQFASIFIKNRIKPTFTSMRHRPDYKTWSQSISKKINSSGFINKDVLVTLASFQDWHYSNFFKKISDSSSASTIFNSKPSSRDSRFVFEDNIVSVETEFRDCHVYTISVSLGYYIANGIIVKNCQALDGKFYEIGEGPQPPAHINCRSVRVPVLKSWRELGIDMDELPPSTRASMNGQVPDDLTYGDWLKKQPVDIQDEVMGIERARLFRESGEPITKFINSEGKYYTLEQLRKMEL